MLVEGIPKEWLTYEILNFKNWTYLIELVGWRWRDIWGEWLAVNRINLQVIG